MIYKMENEYLSLYDYLGRAAGGELGKAVATAAAKSKVAAQTRYVKNPVYEGNVMLYPKNFLNEYFNKAE